MLYNSIYIKFTKNIFIDYSDIFLNYTSINLNKKIERAPPYDFDLYDEKDRLYILDDSTFDNNAD